MFAKESAATVRLAVGFILDRYGDPALNPADVAAVARTDPRQLEEFFILVYGIPVPGFINLFRTILAAECLLRRPSFALGRLRRVCGFASIDLFRTCFEHLLGQSPEEFVARTRSLAAVDHEKVIDLMEYSVDVELLVGAMEKTETVLLELMQEPDSPFYPGV